MTTHAQKSTESTESAESTQSAAYGDSLAGIYDLLYPPSPEAGLVADFVHGLRPAPATLLELGVGTGRLAVPLAERGFRVHGVDSSAEMLRKLAENDITSTITSSVGDFAVSTVGRRFDVVLLALNTLFMLPSQEQQIAALRNIREQLADDGVAVLEMYDPMVFHGLDEPTVRVHHLAADSLVIDTVQVSRSQQTALVVHTVLGPGTVRKVPEVSRYAWPSEFALMARLAGLRITGRFSDWTRTPVTEGAQRHICVLEREA
ncbi:class I SAM-dependent methyltransferase [Streptomyces sp. NBC_01530]|uniref:class I SAM-dependent methyltransferase n=1 Tax=Streptomyces sp. NBC_01530 TaxID=2903895 RepID=UPI00386A75F3